MYVCAQSFKLKCCYIVIYVCMLEVMYVYKLCMCYKLCMYVLIYDKLYINVMCVDSLLNWNVAILLFIEYYANKIRE